MNHQKYIHGTKLKQPVASHLPLFFAEHAVSGIKSNQVDELARKRMECCQTCCRAFLSLQVILQRDAGKHSQQHSDHSVPPGNSLPECQADLEQLCEHCSGAHADQLPNCPTYRCLVKGITHVMPTGITQIDSCDFSYPNFSPWLKLATSQREPFNIGCVRKITGIDLWHVSCCSTHYPFDMQ